MARILAISSQVARGHVGLSASLPALHALGHEVIALPTAILSNHPGHPRFDGMTVEPGLLARMLETLDANGWLSGVDAVLTGYLPSADHVRFAAAAVALVRERHALSLSCVDPIIGDDPRGPYIPEDAALAIRDELLPLADFSTPNRFELGWLSGKLISDGNSAFGAAISLRSRATLATSLPVGGNRLANLLVMKNSACVCVVPRLPTAPHGTGDLLTALFIGHTLWGTPSPDALALAAAGVKAAIEASEGRDELNLIATRDAWSDPEPLPVERF